MQRYANRYIDAEQLNGFIADPRRVLLGMFVAPAVGALATEVPTFTFQSYWGVALLGWLSVITLYLPLVLSRLRRTSRPFLTCVIVGGISAPGLLGYAVAVVGGLLTADPAWIVFPLAATFPLGAIGGAVFWLCVVWRADGWEKPVATDASFSDV